MNQKCLRDAHALIRAGNDNVYLRRRANLTLERCSQFVLLRSETPSSAIPSITPCQGSSGTAPSAPSSAPSGSTYILTAYTYSTGASGNQLQYESTTALGTGSPTALLGFGSSSANLAYDENANLTRSTPILRGSAQSADSFTYDAQQRVASGPEAGVASRSYNYVNSASGYSSSPTVDAMGINAVSGNGTFDYSYSANGQLCWVVSGTGASSNTCANPTGSTAWEGFTYDASGNRTATSANNGFGATSTLTWNQDTGTLGCINTSGTTCTTPSATAPATATYTYDADQLRMSATTWNASTSSTQTASFTWDTSSSALLSDGSFDYVYGLHANVPIAQIDPATSVTSQLLSDTTANVRGVLEVTSSAPSPFALANYTDYDPYGNPTTGADGSVNPGGLSTPSGTDADSATRFGFGGGYLDPTALIYLVHRYYDPATGQFVSVDPMVGSIGTPFSYAGDNPVNRRDSSGLCDCEEGDASGQLHSVDGGLATNSGSGGVNDGADSGGGDTPTSSSGGASGDAQGGDHIQLTEEERALVNDLLSRLRNMDSNTEPSKNFGLGEGTKNVSEVLGEEWLGDGAESRGGRWISADNKRIYRSAWWKADPRNPGQNSWQANYILRSGKFNAHLHITDMEPPQ